MDAFQMPSLKDQYKHKKISINRQDIRDRLDQLDVDPLAFVVNIMEGKEFKEPHPFLKVLYEYVERINNMYTEEERKRFSAVTANMFSVAMEMLNEGYVPVDLRTKAAFELLQYTYAKRKKVEVVDATDEDKKAISMDKYRDMFNNATEADIELIAKDDDVTNNGTGKEVAKTS